MSPLNRRTFLQIAAAAPLISIANPLAQSSGLGAPFSPTNVGQGSFAIENLPDEFYNRDGLEGMPRRNWAAMPVVNVLDHGAVGDGTTPNTAAFQAAVEAVLAEGGGVVAIPAGRYLFKRDWTTTDRAFWDLDSVQNVHFIGQGEGTVIVFEMDGIPASNSLAEHRNSAGWRLVRSTDVTVRDLAFTSFPHHVLMGNENFWMVAANSSLGLQALRLHVEQARSALWMPYTTGAWTVDCDVRNTAQDAIHYESAIGSVAAYNYVEAASDDAIANFTYLPSYPDPSILSDNRIVHNTVLQNVWGRGITLGGTRQTTSDNWIESCDNAGIFSDVGGNGAAQGTLVDAVVARNMLVRNNGAQRADNSYYQYGFSGYGGALSLKAGIDGIVLEDNTILASSGTGICFGIPGWLGATGSDASVRGNSVRGTFGTGIALVASSNISGLDFDSNAIIDNDTGSVALAGTVTGTTSVGNSVSTAPVVTGSVTGDMSGFTLVPDEDWVDHYDPFVRASSESAWVEPQKVLPSRPAQRFNVRQFGALGDGTTDDRVAIQSAIDAAGAAGGVVFFPAGEYRVSPSETPLADTTIRHHLIVNGANEIHFLGQENVSRVVFSDPDAQGLRVIGSTDVSVRVLDFQLQDQPELRKNRALLDVSASERVEISRVRLFDSSGPGLLIDSSRSILVRRVESSAAGTFGISIQASRQVLVKNSKLDDSRDSGIVIGWRGVIAREPQHIRIESNRVHQTREGGGIAVTSGTDVLIRENTVTESYLAGIHLYQRSPQFPQGSVEVRDNVLTNTNTGSETYTPGSISVHGLPRGSRLPAITVTGNVITGGRLHGVWVGGVTPRTHYYSTIGRLETHSNIATNLPGDAFSMDAQQTSQVTELVTTP